MAFTQVALTGKVVLSNSTPAAGATVNLTLNTPITDGVQIIAPEAISARCASDGTFSITVNANDDTTTLPLGTFYSVTIGYGSATLDSFNVIVPHADSPTVNLFTLATLPNPNVVSPYVSQIIAGTNVTVSPLGGTGIVTISATGGGGSSLTPTAVKTANYTAAVGDFVVCDVSGAGFTVTLPTAPADKSQIGLKIVGQAALVNTLTIARGGSDVFNKAGGSTSLTATALFQDMVLQYAASPAIWYVISTDAAVGPTETVATVGTSGASQTIPDPSKAGNPTVSDITLTAACTITLPPTPPAGTVASFSAYLRQDATGGRVPTITSSKWAGHAGPPTFSVAASAIDRIDGSAIPGGGGWIITAILNIG
jgi:hypothetical protein